MEKFASNETLVSTGLAALALFDALIVVWAFGFPDLWFSLLHVGAAPSSEAYLLLQRTGAAWAAFALFQGIAFLHWREQPVWLAVVAGIRFSDIFTDPVYALMAEDPSLLALAGLPLMGVLNLLLGWFFLTAFFVAGAESDA